MKRLVKVAAGVVCNGRGCQVHYKGPGGAHVLAFLRRQGNVIHDSTRSIHLSAEEFISAVSLDQADIPFCFAQVVIGDGGSE